MKEYIKSILIILSLTIAVLFSYTVFPYVVSYSKLDQFFGFLNKDKINVESLYHQGIQELKEEQEAYHKIARNKEKKKKINKDYYKAVWITYREFNAYRNSVEDNNSRNFRKFFRSILDHCESLGINTLIVQVRPFADALYDSSYFPWSAYISGAQGESPGYDPLEIMVSEAHNFNMSIEAWINPYRIAYAESTNQLSENNMARIWAHSKEDQRNVLNYNECLYFNPASKDVQELIIKGIKEIVDGYDVDGIHLDDYFYPEFSEEDYDRVFDAAEYESYREQTDDPLSIMDWRRQNINQLVKEIYTRVHKTGKTFGISPAGNLANLRSDFAYYVDIDRWVSQKGYVDYITPQIYWGFTNTLAPFEDVLHQWEELLSDSKVSFYVGLPLYKIASEDTEQSDYEELQSEDFLNHQIVCLQKEKAVKGYCLFSYQYLDPYNEDYNFESCNFSEERKEILAENAEYLE